VLFYFAYGRIAMKKFFASVSAVIVVCILSSYVFSAGFAERIQVLKDVSGVDVNGKKLDTQAFRYDGEVYAPVGDIAGALGAKYTWDQKTGAVSITAASVRTINISYPGTVDALDPRLKLDVIGVDAGAVDAFRFENKGKSTDARLSFEDGMLVITPGSWLDYNTDYQLKLFMNNGDRYIIKLRTGGLPKLTADNKQKIIFVPADPSKGFNYPYYLILPRKLSVDLNKGKKTYLLVEPHNTGKVGDDLEFHINEALTIAQGNSAQIADALGVPRIVPILVRPESKIMDQWVYTHALSRNTIILDDLKKQAGTYDEVFEPMSRVDRQVASMIKHAIGLLRKDGWKMEDKVFMWGFSASGDFVNRFSFLYPELVRAAIFSGFPIAPVSKEGGYNMIYPLGTYDYKQITGKDFSIAAYNSVARLGYIGSVDNNDPTILDTPYEREIVDKLLSLKEYPDKWEKMKKIYAKSGGEAQANVYIGASHETFYKGMTQDYLNFSKANRDSDKPVYVKPSDPAGTLTDIYSKNVIEMKKEPFSYDKTTITEAFWYGTVPKTLPDSFTDWYVRETGKNVNKGILMISIYEWDPGNPDQMGERIRKVSGKLTLKAKGYKDIVVEMNGGSMTSGKGDAQLYFAYVHNPDDIVPGVKYTITDTTGHWKVMDGVYAELPAGK
jgi:hypothetical protein